MDTFKDALSHHKSTKSVANQLHATATLQAFTVAAKKIWGTQVEQDMRPLYLKNGTLTIAVTNAPLAQELKLHEQELLAELQEHSDEKIERLRYLL